MSDAATGRTHNLAEIDITDLSAVNAALKVACAIGHWRRILAIYGDHLPACAWRLSDKWADCNCGWAEAFCRES